ncbi:MFS transporter [Metallosphaera cuprina]|uniref:Major facilitator transporter n=1 Tax=Metallosphaera cuprina (strain Ar-4) TaxID=1006006 RepID=F4G1J2_METCR|nr:MFS transporter [Metallosphaera cuprina]AEB94805.1 major facilitator transporter [Metallosphaera cuprina Ar-4]
MSDISSFDRRFKLLIFNAGLSRFGLASFNLIIIWIILFETKNAFLAGLGDGIMSLPLFFSFFVGALVDRAKGKKAIAIAAGVLRSVFPVTILYGFYLNSLILILISIYASGFILGLTSDMMNSIRASWTKEILKEEHYKSGSSVSLMVSYIAAGGGYALSGVILAFGFYHAFATIIAVFALALIPIFFIRTNFRPRDVSAMTSLKEGIEFMRKHREIVQLMIIALILNVVFGTIGIIFISLVQIGFHLPAIFASIIFSTFIIGLVIGSFLGGKVKGKIGSISVIILVSTGLLITSISFLTSVFYVLVPAMLVGIAIGIANVIYNTLMLHIVSQDLMARISGAFSTFSVAATFSSGILGGAIIEVTSINHSFIVIGVFIIVSTVLWFFFKQLYEMRI